MLIYAAKVHQVVGDCLCCMCGLIVISKLWLNNGPDLQQLFQFRMGRYLSQQEVTDTGPLVSMASHLLLIMHFFVSCLFCSSVQSKD